MRKNIMIKMLEDKSIVVSVNGEDKYTISVESRAITAKDIYETLDFKEGDEYDVKCENMANSDSKPLTFFYELFQEITNKVNDLRIEEES